MKDSRMQDGIFDKVNKTIWHMQLAEIHDGRSGGDPRQPAGGTEPFSRGLSAGWSDVGESTPGGGLGFSTIVFGHYTRFQGEWHLNNSGKKHTQRERESNQAKPSFCRGLIPTLLVRPIKRFCLCTNMRGEAKKIVQSQNLLILIFEHAAVKKVQRPLPGRNPSHPGRPQGPGAASPPEVHPQK